MNLAAILPSRNEPSTIAAVTRAVDTAPGPQAVEISARTGKPAEIVQPVLDNSTEYFLATERGPIIAWHTLGYHPPADHRGWRQAPGRDLHRPHRRRRDHPRATRPRCSTTGRDTPDH